MSAERLFVHGTPTEELLELARLNDGTPMVRIVRRIVDRRQRRREEIAAEEYEKLEGLGGEFAAKSDALEFARDIGFPLIALREYEPGNGYPSDNVGPNAGMRVVVEGET